MQNSGFAADEPGNPVFEVDVNRLSPAQEADRCEAVAPLVECPASGFLNSRMVGEAEVVIRGEHYDFTAVDDNITALLALERDFVLESLCLLDTVQLAIESVVELLGVHSYLLDVGAGRNEQQLDCFMSANQLEALLEILERDRLAPDYLFKPQAQPGFFGSEKVKHREPGIEHAASEDTADRYTFPYGILSEIEGLQRPRRDAEQQDASSVFDERPGVVISGLSSAHLENNVDSTALLGCCSVQQLAPGCGLD